MKSMLRRFIPICLSLVVLMSLTVTAFAADDNVLTINGGAEVNVGDRVKYTLYLADTKEEIIGFQLALFFDKEYLELDKNSMSFDKFDGVIYNADLDDSLPMNWTNISHPADFSKKAMFLSLEFRVLKGGETDISQFVTEMYGDDMTYLKSYTWTYDISVNDNAVVSDQTPLINDDEEYAEKNSGSIVNYLDGMGEENTPNKDNHPAVVGYSQTVTEIVDVTKANSSSEESGDFPITTVIIGAAVMIVVLAVVGVVVIKKRDDGNTATTSDENKSENDDDLAE